MRTVDESALDASTVDELAVPDRCARAWRVDGRQEGLGSLARPPGCERAPFGSARAPLRELCT